MVAPSLTPLMQRPDVDDPSITDSQVLEPLSPP